jgi:hypothetical protein
MWTRMAAAAQGDNPLHQGKRAVAEFFAHRMLSQVPGLVSNISAGEASLMTLESDYF